MVNHHKKALKIQGFFYSKRNKKNLILYSSHLQTTIHLQGLYTTSRSH